MKLKQKLKNTWKWLRTNIFNRTMIVPGLIAEAIFWSPVWVPAILGLVVNPWWWTVSGAVVAFWAGPFTPAIALQIGFILAVKKLFDKIKSKRRLNNVHD